MITKLLMVLAMLLAVAATVQAQTITVQTVNCPQAYNIVNDSVICINCAAGFAAVNGTCTPNNTKDLNTGNVKNFQSELEKFIDTTGEKITPENPSLGRAGIVLFALLMFILVLLRLPDIMKKIFK